MRSINVDFRYGMFSFKLSASKKADEKSKGIQLHSFHKTDNGEIGMSFYCKKCGEKTQRSDTIKGYNLADKTVYLTDSEIAAFADVPAEISFMGIYNGHIPADRIKNVYKITPSLEKKTSKNNKSGFAILYDYLKNGKIIIVKSKLSNRGFKSSGDLAALAYNANGVDLITMYYADEMNELPEIGEMPVFSNDLLVKAEDKLFGKAENLDINAINESQTEKIMDLIANKMLIPQDKQMTESIVSNEDDMLKAIIGE